jgi:phospholipase C
MFVISPWSKGGWVSSEIFDHTSLIRFVQARFGTERAPLTDPNITPWRKAVCGDLTSAFNFATPNETTTKLPSTAAYVPPNNQRQTVSYVPLPPAIQTMPVQEAGVRSARPVPYRINATLTANLSTELLTLSLDNSAARTAVFQVRSANPLQAPRCYTVGSHQTVTDAWQFAPDGLAAYDLSVYGPNGFFRHYRGGATALSATNLASTIAYHHEANSITVAVKNIGTQRVIVTLKDVYTGTTTLHTFSAGAHFDSLFSVTKQFGWYDLVLTVESDSTFLQQISGHLETDKPSITDPAIG